MRHLLPVLFLPFTLACGGATFVTGYADPITADDGGSTLEAATMTDDARNSTVEASAPALDAVTPPPADGGPDGLPTPGEEAGGKSDGGHDAGLVDARPDVTPISCEMTSCTAGGAACCPPTAIYCGRDDASAEEKCCWGGCL